MSPKLLSSFVVGCNNEHSSHSLLPTSELMKTQGITLVFERNEKKSNDRQVLKQVSVSLTQCTLQRFFLNYIINKKKIEKE